MRPNRHLPADRSRFRGSNPQCRPGFGVCGVSPVSLLCLAYCGAQQV